MELRFATLLMMVVVLMLVPATLFLLLLVLRLATLVLLLGSSLILLVLGLALLLLLGLLLLLLRLGLRSTTVVGALMSRLIGVLSMFLSLLNEGFEVHLLLFIVFIIAIVGQDVINIIFIFREILVVFI